MLPLATFEVKKKQLLVELSERETGKKCYYHTQVKVGAVPVGET